MRRSVLPALLTACSFEAGTLAPPQSDATVSDGTDARVIDALTIDSQPDAPRCPADFVSIGTGTSVYKPVTTPATYSTAVTFCAGIASTVRLARIDTQAEANALYSFMDAAVTVGDTNVTRVVGQRHANGAGPADDTWHDLDDVTLLAFLPWGNMEPTNAVGENCMSLRAEFVAQTDRVTGADDCITPRPFACECE